MTARDEHLVGVLCHCDQTQGLPEDGHPLGTPGCSTEIKAGNRGPSARCRKDHSWEQCSGCNGPARGTCPECGKYGRVVQIKARAGDGKALIGASAPGMAPHKVGGQECPGAGAVPTETTYTPGRALTEWLRAEKAGAA